MLGDDSPILWYCRESRVGSNPRQKHRHRSILFTDIEGSTLLWERDAERMRLALARHDQVLRGAVESYRGTVMKMMGDGMYAAFDDPLDAIRAALRLQRALAGEVAPDVALRVRCGLHLGVVERRDGDLFGTWSTGLRESWGWPTVVRFCFRRRSLPWSAIDCPATSLRDLGRSGCARRDP